MENYVILSGQNFSISEREGGYFNVETNGLVGEQFIEGSSQPQVIAALCAQQQAALVEMAGMLIRCKESYEQIKTEGKALQPTEQKPTVSACTCGENEACGDCVVEKVKSDHAEKCHCNACHAKEHIAIKRADDYLREKRLNGFSHTHFSQNRVELERAAAMYGTAYFELTIFPDGGSASRVLEPRDVVLPKQ